MDALYSYWEPASLNTSGNQRNEAQGIPAGRFICGLEGTYLFRLFEYNTRYIEYLT
jgi:hypothetical protein